LPSFSLLSIVFLYVYTIHLCVFVFVRVCVFLCVCLCVCIQVARNLLNFGIGRLRLVDCQVPLDACYSHVSGHARASASVLTRTVRLTISRAVCACVCARAWVRSSVRPCHGQRNGLRIGRRLGSPKRTDLRVARRSLQGLVAHLRCLIPPPGPDHSLMARPRSRGRKHLMCC